MKMNLKYVIFFVALLITLVSVASAADVHDSTSVSSDVETSTISQAAHVASDTQVVKTKNSKENGIKNVQTVTKNVTKNEDNKQSQAAEILKKSKLNNIKSEAKTILVNQDNVDDIFSGIGYTLGENVTDGDTLDFQGLIDKNHSLVINKPVKVVSSTKDAVISLHTIAGSLMGEDPGNSFVINKGASGSFISGLYLDNTECWVHNLYNSTLYNMTMHVKDARVGSGVGQTSLRYCNNVTMDSCHIYTENNGGSSSFVWTGSNNCTIVNSTVEAVGNVGNILYVGNPYNTADMPADYVMSNVDNRVINCTVIGGSGGISNPLQNMATRTLIQGNKFYSGGSASAGTNGTFIDNEFYSTVSIGISANCVAHGNIHYGTGSATVQANAKVYNNTFHNATVSGANAIFENNTVKSRLTLSQPVNVKNSNLNEVQVNTNAKNSNITANNVTGTIRSQAANVTIDSNNITTNNDNTVVVTGAANKVTNNILFTRTKAGDDTLSIRDDTITGGNVPEAGSEFELTDETYSLFFDNNGNLINANVTNYSTLTFKGAFNDKVFKFENIVVSLNGDNAVINNGFISADNGAIIALENVAFNNTKEGIPNSVLLNSDNNLVRNVKVYRTSSNGISREIMVNGDKNTIMSNTFDLSIPVENIDYSEYPFAMSNASAISITGSDNTITSNVITVRNTTGGYGTISVIDLASKTESRDNTVNSNTIMGESTGYLYGVNLGANTGYNTINSNNIKLTSDVYTAGIQIGYSPAESNTINSNTINITSPLAYGILASAYGGSVTNTTINSNKVYVSANQGAGIELCGSTQETIKDATITSNTVLVDGNYAIGMAIAGSDIKLLTNTINVTGTTNATDETSYDIIKPTTAGIILYNSENIEAYNNTINAENGADVIFNSTSNSKLISTLSTNTRYINAENNANIVLYNSNNNIIDTQRAYSNNEYAVVMIASSNNNITNNNLNGSNIRGGDSAISMDENSKDNYLYNNIPAFGLLTDETYSALFDENGVYKFPGDVDIVTLAGDLHNKDLIFTNNLTFVNGGNFTIYNGSIIIRDVEGTQYTDRFVNFRNININNTDKAAFIDDLSQYRQRNIQFNGGVFAVTGDDITAFESVHANSTYSILDVSGVTVIMDGNDATAFRMVRDSYSRNDYLDVENSNITIKATGKNRAFEVINTNLDILNNNIVQEGGQVSTLYAIDVYANSEFFMNNNINATGDNIELITLKDNHGSNPSFGYNTIYTTSSNPVTVMNISNATNVYVGQGRYTYASYNKPNTIISDSENGETPLIYISENGYVRNNFIMSNDLYGPEAVSAATVSNITPVRGKVDVTISIEDKTLTAYEENTINVNVTGLLETPLNETITATINGEDVEIIDNIITYTPELPGEATLVVSYTDPDGIYKNKTVTKVFTIPAPTSTVTPASEELKLGDVTNLTAELYDEDGIPVTGGYAIFRVNGKTLRDSEGNVIYVPVTDSRNVVLENVTIDEDWMKPDTTIQAIYTGDDTTEPIFTEAIKVNVTKPEATITLNAPTTATAGETITITATVTDGDKQINSGRVAFKLNGKTLKGEDGKALYVNVENGIATIDYTIPEKTKAKDYTLTAVFTDITYERCQADTTLSVTKA